jgi:hypothetical protein
MNNKTSFTGVLEDIQFDISDTKACQKHFRKTSA